MRVSKTMLPYRSRRRGPPQGLKPLEDDRVRHHTLENVLQQVLPVLAADREELARVIEPCGRELSLEPQRLDAVQAR